MHTDPYATHRRAGPYAPAVQGWYPSPEQPLPRAAGTLGWASLLLVLVPLLVTMLLLVVAPDGALVHLLLLAVFGTMAVVCAGCSLHLSRRVGARCSGSAVAGLVLGLLGLVPLVLLVGFYLLLLVSL